MNASFLSKAAAMSTGLLVSILLTGNASAGPGPQYWQQQEKLRAESAAKAADAERAQALMHRCSGAQTVADTVMKSSWHNGRGPLTEVQIGTKTVCHMCPVTTVVTKNAWPNGRGPTTRTEVTQTGVEHTCTNCSAVALK